MDFLECKICHVPYDEEEHRPRHAPCGHEICTACIGALIKDSIFECPKCRQKNKIDAPNNMPINFGLIDVIRAFKSKRIPMAKETGSSASGASNEEMCIIHCKSLTHWCFKCQIWICKECIEAHTLLVGCTTASAPKAMENMKEKHNKSMDILLATFEQDTKYMAFNIKELNDKKRELLEKAEKCGEEAQKIYNVLEQGENHKEMLVESTNLLNETTSRDAFSEKIKVVTQRKQILHTWSIKNLATSAIDTPAGLLKALEAVKSVYTEMVVKDEKRQAIISQHEESVHLHPLLKQTVSDGFIFMPFDRLKKMIPSAPMVFVELNLGGVVKGHVYIRLDQNLPHMRDNVVHIVTGQQGPTLAGSKFNVCDQKHYIRTSDLPTSEMKLTPDSSATYKAKTGDVLGYTANGYLENILFHVPSPPITNDYGSKWSVFGRIEKGLKVVQECLDNYRSGVIISDCGLVIEQE